MKFALRWMSGNSFDRKSTLVQVMVCCRQPLPESVRTQNYVATYSVNGHNYSILLRPDFWLTFSPIKANWPFKTRCCIFLWGLTYVNHGWPSTQPNLTELHTTVQLPQSCTQPYGSVVWCRVVCSWLGCVEGHSHGWRTQPCNTLPSHRLCAAPLPPAGLCAAPWLAAGLCAAQLCCVEDHP